MRRCLSVGRTVGRSDLTKIRLDNNSYLRKNSYVKQTTGHGQMTNNAFTEWAHCQPQVAFFSGGGAPYMVHSAQINPSILIG